MLRDLGEVEPRPIPRHVWMIPSEPGKPLSIRREPRRSIEIVPGRQHLYGPAIVAEIDGYNGINRLAVHRVILAHADPAATVRVDHPVGEAPLPSARGGLGRERLRLRGSWHMPIQAAVREIGEIDRPISHGP